MPVSHIHVKQPSDFLWLLGARSLPRRSVGEWRPLLARQFVDFVVVLYERMKSKDRDVVISAMDNDLAETADCVGFSVQKRFICYGDLRSERESRVGDLGFSHLLRWLHRNRHTSLAQWSAASGTLDQSFDFV